MKIQQKVNMLKGNFDALVKRIEDLIRDGFLIDSIALDDIDFIIIFHEAEQSGDIKQKLVVCQGGGLVEFQRIQSEEFKSNYYIATTVFLDNEMLIIFETTAPPLQCRSYNPSNTYERWLVEQMHYGD